MFAGTAELFLVQIFKNFLRAGPQGGITVKLEVDFPDHKLFCINYLFFFFHSQHENLVMLKSLCKSPLIASSASVLDRWACTAMYTASNLLTWAWSNIKCCGFSKS